MFALLPAFRAWDRLHDQEHVGKLRTADYYDLVLAATNDKELASKLASDHGIKRLEADLPV